MKRIITLIIAVTMCFALAACEKQEASESGEELHIRITNEVESIYGLDLSYYFDDVPVLSTGMKHTDTEIIWTYGDREDVPADGE